MKYHGSQLKICETKMHITMIIMYDIVWETIQEDIPELKEYIEKLLTNEV